jgi:T4 RnlA family RNA ligase
MFTLSEAMEALSGHDEFVVKNYDGLVCLDYIVCFPGSFDSTPVEVTARATQLGGQNFLDQAEADCKRFAWYRRNFRGVTFDERTGEIVSLPLHKFFNVNQTVETQFDLLSSCQATIYEKLDGSMIHFFEHPVHKEVLASTCRSTQTSQAQDALALAKKNPLVFDRIRAIIAEGWTPVFEFVAAHNQIVVQYPRPRLVYLISRNRKTGAYHFHDGFKDVAKSFEFPFKDVFSYLDKEEFEGYVCHLDNGMMVKAKTPWYMERHRAVDALMRPAYKLYDVVFKGVMDDLLPVAPDRFKPRLTAIYEEAQRDLLDEKLRVEKLFNDVLNEVAPASKYPAHEVFLPYRKGNRVLRKEVALYCQEKYAENFSLLMSLYLGNDVTSAIKDRLMEGYKIKYPHRLFADLETDDVEADSGT